MEIKKRKLFKPSSGLFIFLVLPSPALLMYCNQKPSAQSLSPYLMAEPVLAKRGRLFRVLPDHREELGIALVATIVLGLGCGDLPTVQLQFSCPVSLS